MDRRGFLQTMAVTTAGMAAAPAIAVGGSGGGQSSTDALHVGGALEPMDVEGHTRLCTLAQFCVPAQQTIPILVKWMLVYEEPDREVLHVGRALPRAWVGSGKGVRIAAAPTRWGRVGYSLVKDGERLVAKLDLAKGDAAESVHVRF